MLPIMVIVTITKVSGMYNWAASFTGWHIPCNHRLFPGHFIAYTEAVNHTMDAKQIELNLPFRIVSGGRPPQYHAQGFVLQSDLNYPCVEFPILKLAAAHV